VGHKSPLNFSLTPGNALEFYTVCQAWRGRVQHRETWFGFVTSYLYVGRSYHFSVYCFTFTAI